jgi:ribonuclease E
MGKRKIIVSERDNLAALFEDDQALEFIINRGDTLLGDIYLCTVENILPSIDAAFVNIGGDKMGFLHASDVQGKGELKHRLQPRQQLVVQVMKEPTGHKGPRVTTNISLPGRFLVLMPESKGISISRKIEQQSERSRLKSILSLMKPPGVGVIIRTEADQQKEADIQEDFETLLERWQNIVAMADTTAPPTLLYRDQDLLYRVIREVVTDEVRDIYVDTTFGQQRAQQLLQNWNLDKSIKLNLYTGSQSILVGMGVDKEIKQALQTKVPLPRGGYLYIQPTEALTVIDVNSGKFTSLESQAETIKLTNLEAAKEIARQLRLRNIGGMIIVDFIDMETRADQLAILEAFENELAPDKAKPQVGQLSDLGLVELTRHRQGQALSEIFTKRCIACNGTGHALEEFNWAPPHLDGDARNTKTSQMARHKLPLRSVKPAVAPVQPGAKAANGAGGSGAAPMSPTMSLRKILENKNADVFNKGKPGGAAGGRPGGSQTGADGTASSQDGQLLAARTFADELASDKPLDDIYKDKLFSTYAIRMAYVAKFGHTPPVTNGHLSRINPKANDVLTLLETLEGGGSLPVSPMEEGEEADNDTPSSVGPKGTMSVSNPQAAVDIPMETEPAMPAAASGNAPAGNLVDTAAALPGGLQPVSLEDASVPGAEGDGNRDDVGSDIRTASKTRRGSRGGRGGTSSRRKPVGEAGMDAASGEESDAAPVTATRRRRSTGAVKKEDAPAPPPVASLEGLSP